MLASAVGVTYGGGGGDGVQSVPRVRRRGGVQGGWEGGEGTTESAKWEALRGGVEAALAARQGLPPRARHLLTRDASDRACYVFVQSVHLLPLDAHRVGVEQLQGRVRRVQAAPSERLRVARRIK